MDEKKLLTIKNSKAREMLEAIAINKQTENLRKNKLGLFDRAKQILNSARNAKDNAIVKMKGAISDLQLKQKVKDNAKSILIGSTAFITLTGGIIGFNALQHNGPNLEDDVKDRTVLRVDDGNKETEAPTEDEVKEENHKDPNQKVTKNGTVDKHGKYTNEDGTLKDEIKTTTEHNKAPETKTATGSKENTIKTESSKEYEKQQDAKIQADKDAGKSVESYSSTVEIGGNKVTYNIEVTTDANGKKDTSVTKKEEPTAQISSKENKDLSQGEVKQAQDVNQAKQNIEQKKEETKPAPQQEVQEMSDDDLADLFK